MVSGMYRNEEGLVHIEKNVAMLALIAMAAFGGVFAYRYWGASPAMAVCAAAGGVGIGLGVAYVTIMGHYHASVVPLVGAVAAAGVNGALAMMLVARGAEAGDPAVMLALAQGGPLALYAGIALVWRLETRNEEKKRKEEAR